MSVQKLREEKSESSTETQECPVCNETFTDAAIINQCSILPDELEVKHCFISTMEGILVIEHAEDPVSEFNEDEAVEIEVE